jgi:hypothetical protein
MKNLKPVPADKKKSLGKLPTDVRNKMGYAQKGKMMSNRDKRQEEITKKQNPKSEYKKDKFGKTKLSYTEAKKGKMMKTIHSTDHPDVKMTQKLYAKNKIYAGSKEEIAKNLDEIQNKIAKKRTKTEGSFSKGGEMKKPMKAGLGKMVKKLVGSVFGKKSSTVNPTPGGQIMGEGKTPLTALYQKVTEQKTPKKSMGGEMKQGYGAARTSGMGLQDEDLIPGKSMDYYKDLM